MRSTAIRRMVLALSLSLGSSVALLSPAAGSQFNKPGNVLIADQFNNRVIEITPAGGIVFQYGKGPCDFSPRSIIGTNDAQRVGNKTLMAGTGNPGGFGCCTSATGCPDNRVLLVNSQGHIEWQYGQFGPGGSGPNRLNTPVQSTWLPTGDVLITDQANQRVIDVAPDKRIVWQYGQTETPGCCGDNVLNTPNSAELLENGHVLISDEGNNRAIEVTRAHHIVTTFTTAGGVPFNAVAFASRLENGNTLITDSNNARIVEVAPVPSQDAIVWECDTNTDPASNPMPLPTRAIRLKSGNTIISDQFNHRVTIVDHGTPCHIVTTYGLPLANGANTGYGTLNANQGLNGPYDAKVVGDFTGITAPRDQDEDESDADDR